MQIGDNSGMRIGNPMELPKKTLTPPTGVYKSYVLQDFNIICFMEVEKDGQTFWEYPLVLETVMEQDPQTGQISKSRAFRPLAPFSKEIKFKPLSTNFLCEIEDERMQDIYNKTIQSIRMQMSGIVTPNGNPPGKLIV